MRLLAKNFFFLFFLLSVTPSAAAEQSPASPTKAVKRRIVFLGDSLTEGYGVDARFSYPARIQRRIEASEYPFTVVNAGVSGDTSAGGLRRIQWLLRSPIDVLVLALGANDGLRGLSVDSTEENLVATVSAVRRKYPSARILLAGMLVPPNMGDDYAADFQAIFPKVAKKTKSKLIPFLLEGVAGEPELNLSDGIHPNEDGYKLIAQTVWHALEPVLRSIKAPDRREEA